MFFDFETWKICPKNLTGTFPKIKRITNIPCCKCQKGQKTDNFLQSVLDNISDASNQDEIPFFQKRSGKILRGK